MIAKTQYQVTPADLEMTLAMVRGGTLAKAGERLGIDASTVFRSLQRIERGLGSALFHRTRPGHVATELASRLPEHAEQMEAALEAARSDIAVRATRRPPQHLVGKQGGVIRVALYAAKSGRRASKRAEVDAGRADWIAPDDALPEHPSVLWRKRHFPKVDPRYRVNSIPFATASSRVLLGNRLSWRSARN
jgi:hypothetical protein